LFRLGWSPVDHAATGRRLEVHDNSVKRHAQPLTMGFQVRLFVCPVAKEPPNTLLGGTRHDVIALARCQAACQQAVERSNRSYLFYVNTDFLIHPYCQQCHITGV
jgi:hypothetical protein